MINVGEFLDQNVGFRFNLPEHLSAYQHAPFLIQRFDRFNQWHASTDKSVTNQNWFTDELFDRCESLIGILAYSDSFTCEASKDKLLEQYAKLDLISKSDLREDSKKFINSCMDHDNLWWKETSGTTGPPVRIWYSPEFHFEFTLYGVCKVASLAGAFSDTVRTSPVFCVSLTDNQNCTEQIWLPPDGSRGLSVQFVIDVNNLDSFEKVMIFLDTYNPPIMAMKPCVLEAFIQFASYGLRDINLTDTLLVSSGSDLRYELRSNAEKSLGCFVTNAYGQTEFGIVAAECSEREGMHIFEDQVAASILDDQGNVLEEGNGQLVLSSVSNLAMPLLKYNTGDIVTLDSKPCSCGIPGKRIINLSGRFLRNYTKIDGSLLSPAIFNRLFDKFPVREFQMNQEKEGSIRCEVEFNNNTVDKRQLLSSLDLYLSTLAGSGMVVKVYETQFDHTNKFERYRSVLWQ
ncbi:MAG: hypothetical protein N0E59_21710 [Candidatus Thiodiazotropha taylori]|nr:hypothetical protein [Candidatus Thiodiazotropha taylori]MCG8096931.1 hypothetical protein [Candidatus Thiodiazotropha endolucinida]MCW4281436.1 hypothetical protein [Candidatus Thiodiazotropha taylori]MCW4285738.1 hypothetical protein [Candidatus Thiodiazotropha taylori]MCW4305564.1 hypothetical protein [Candidatus Thiodiazotropha taylori]